MKHKLRSFSVLTLAIFALQSCHSYRVIPPQDYQILSEKYPPNENRKYVVTFKNENKKLTAQDIEVRKSELLIYHPMNETVSLSEVKKVAVRDYSQSGTIVGIAGGVLLGLVMVLAILGSALSQEFSGDI